MHSLGDTVTVKIFFEIRMYCAEHVFHNLYEVARFVGPVTMCSASSAQTRYDDGHFRSSSSTFLPQHLRIERERRSSMSMFCTRCNENSSLCTACCTLDDHGAMTEERRMPRFRYNPALAI